MDNGELKEEHTKESYVAAARMGAGILECDVTFTKDRELVCRHSQCDLHTTTNILDTPLAAKCAEPFVPAVIDQASGEVVMPASTKCCTSDITNNDGDIMMLLDVLAQDVGIKGIFSD